MLTRQLRAVACIVALCMGAAALAGEAATLLNEVEVREAQRLLAELGHSPGPADGQWGAALAARVRCVAQRLRPGGDAGRHRRPEGDAKRRRDRTSTLASAVGSGYVAVHGHCLAPGDGGWEPTRMETASVWASHRAGAVRHREPRSGFTEMTWLEWAAQ